MGVKHPTQCLTQEKKKKKRQATKKPKSTQNNPNSSRDSNQNIIQEKENGKLMNSTEI